MMRDRRLNVAQPIKNRGDQLVAILLTDNPIYTRCLTNAFYTEGRGKNIFYFSRKPRIMGTPNLADGLDFAKIFLKNWF